jgi:hypothetical protein
VGKDENREIKKAPIVETPTMVASYRHLKQALLTSPVLGYPQFDSKNHLFWILTGRVMPILLEEF